MEDWKSRNPFLSRAGFDSGMRRLQKCSVNYCRNPFLSRAGFDNEKIPLAQLRGGFFSRNPFLSRAGFDRS